MDIADIVEKAHVIAKKYCDCDAVWFMYRKMEPDSILGDCSLVLRVFYWIDREEEREEELHAYTYTRHRKYNIDELLATLETELIKKFGKTYRKIYLESLKKETDESISNQS